jgi:hypothetical protein
MFHQQTMMRTSLLFCLRRPRFLWWSKVPYHVSDVACTSPVEGDKWEKQPSFIFKEKEEDNDTAAGNIISML